MYLFKYGPASAAFAAMVAAAVPRVGPQSITSSPAWGTTPEPAQGVAPGVPARRQTRR